MPSLPPILVVLDQLYPDPSSAETPFRLLVGVQRVRDGQAPDGVARTLGLRSEALRNLLSSADPIVDLFGSTFAAAGPEHPKHAGARKNLGQLLLGRLAEQVFERLYKREMGTEELQLRDFRESRNDTDYHLFNGMGRKVFRLNIKFHGTLFRRSKELVGLDPEDCFALATYKIWQGLRKEEEERLPYIFLVVSVPHLTGEAVGALIPDDLARLATILRGAGTRSSFRKRDMEDRMVGLLAGDRVPPSFVGERREIVSQLEGTDWRALSATRASKLLRDLLFDRVYAVRVRGFAQNYRNAELDMHFSLSSDLTPLTTFLSIYKEGGLPLLASKLSRGDI